MAITKPLNLVTGEQLNANREQKNAISSENDAQAFAQTLRQQMQQEANTKVKTDAEDRLQHQIRTSQQQIERARLAAQSAQAKPKQTSSVTPEITPAKNKVVQATVDATQADSNDVQADKSAVADPMQNTLGKSAEPLSADSLIKQDAKHNAEEDIVDDNIIANTGWLASMMAMRDSQTMSSNPPVTTDAEHKLVSTTLPADSMLMPEVAQAEGLSSKKASNLGNQTDNQNSPLDDLSALQPDKAVTVSGQNVVLGVEQEGAKRDEAQELASFELKNSTLVDGRQNNQLLLSEKPLAAMSKALEQQGVSPTDDMQHTLNMQAPASFNAANSPSLESPVMVSQLNVPFGIKGWQEAMNHQVMRMTQQGNEMATITLSPPDLGPVQVVLRVDNQSVDTAFISDNANVRQALEDGLQDLKARMASQGLQLSNTFVGNGNQAQQHFNDQSRPSPQAITQLNTAPNSETVANSIRSQPHGLVDTFV